MRKLVVYTETDTESLRTAAEIGWDGVFVEWTRGFDPDETLRRIREQGLFLQSVHAPFGGIWRLWEGDGEAAAAELDEQLACLRDTARMGCDLVILHAIIGMERNSPTEQDVKRGVERFAKLVGAARELGIRIAFENTEGEVYLKTLLDAFDAEPHVGFCVDTGHELCYNRAKDMIGAYGKRLFGTHLNDNMGMTGETPTWCDDSHMLPFDGIADWVGIARRLKAADFTGPLTFELVKVNRPDRHTNDRYERMSYREYMTAAYEHARCFASIVEHT